jgi:hypothetical protein
MPRQARWVAAGMLLASLCLAGHPRDGSVPDPENRTKPPPASDDLAERAEHLYRAIAENDPGLGDDFFFPREPFVPLKDVQDPGRYHAQLLAAYHRDIRELHSKRKDWSGSSFASFELGTPPTWVSPGKEYNKVGYYRTFHGKLRYRTGERTTEIDVGTIISWDGRWYVTHLLPIRH